MTNYSILNFNQRNEFRKWLTENCTTEKECWLPVKRENVPMLFLLAVMD